MKKVIDIELVQAIQRQKDYVNMIPLEDIIWYENDQRLDINSEIIREFEKTGLNNIDFITSGYYLRKPENEK
jgi:hypothetical protein